MGKLAQGASSKRQEGRWVVRLAAVAERDFQQIVLWTAQQFGAAQARVYAATLSSALEALSAGPAVIGAQARDDIARGLYTLHVARQGRKGRHFVKFRASRDHRLQIIEVLRLLHDAMDLPRHLPPSDETE